MDLNSLSLPEWLPWWAVVGALVPVALYLAMFLLMPFHTFGLRGRIAQLEARLDEIQGDLRVLTLRLPEPGQGFEAPVLRRGGHPPIPPAEPERDLPVAARGGAVGGGAGTGAGSSAAAAGGGFGDPVADRMLAYMRDKAQTDLQRAGTRGPGRTEPRLSPPPGLAPSPFAETPPPDAAAPPRAPRVLPRFGRRTGGEDDPGDPRFDSPR